MIPIKKSNTLFWTSHAKAKMRHYGLSESRVKRIIHTPKRIEEGIAPKTVAMMQPAGSKKNPYELWVMIQVVAPKRRGDSDSPRSRFSGAGRSVGKVHKVISAWRYPGVTKPGQPLPEEIIREMRSFI
jgi:hypothetical protein